ncbi:MAG: hypothetical protein ACI9YU_002071 [Flavobacteriales bacterium]|jgi:hypothetical protein
MKKINLIFTAILVTLSIQSFAQAPNGFNYQAVVRDGSGDIIPTQAVTYRFNILEGSAVGTEVYTEDHSVTTDDRGLVNMVIGEGATSDNFSNIDWGSDIYFLEVEVDENGGANYTTLGSSQFMSVPYALHAKTADDVDDADADASNELQTLSISGSNLSLSNGNTVSLPSSSVETDALAKAWVHVPVTGNPNLAFDGFGVTNVSHSTTGVYVISFAPGTFGIATNPAMVATLINDLAPGFAIPTYIGGPSQVTVRTYNSSGTLTNKEFNLVVFGKD